MQCRAWYFSNDGDGRRQAIYKSFLTPVARDMFPKSFVVSDALKWAKGWILRHSIYPPSSDLHDVEYETIGEIPQLFKNIFPNCLDVEYALSRV